METGLGLHQALADPRRSRIVDELRGQRDGLDTEQLARALELHPNTVRWHLGILGDAGIVESQTEPRTGPGRPRILYRLTPEGRKQLERETTEFAQLIKSIQLVMRST